MNFSEPFIRRPVMTTLVMAAILVFGIMAYKSLPVSDLPNVDYPTIQVTVEYPGANPQTMAATCAVPLEREFMTVNGLNLITSQSSTGSSQFILQFALDKNIDSASVDVQAAISRAQPYLPKDLPYNPTYKKVNPADTPILYLTITSPSMDLAKLYDYGNTFMGKRISMVQGVSEVQVYGAPYAARIQVNPEQLAAKGIGIDEVSQAIREGNVDLPTGTLFGQETEFTIDVQGQLFHAEGYNELAIRSKDGSLVKISQIGRALNSLKYDKYYLHFLNKKKDQASVIMAIRKQAGENTVRVIQDIAKLIPELQRSLPESLEIHTVYDKSEVIVAGVDDVKLTLIIAFILVVIIIYLYLGKLLNTIIPTLALPMAIIGTFAIMFFLHFSIDILSLLALTLSIGFLVDDAIVVLENNVRHVQMGQKPFEASINGSKEIGTTIVSMTLCLAAVFIPMLFMAGIVGRLFREFSLTIISAVLFSGVISLTLTPLLSSRFVPAYTKEIKKGWMERFSDKINEKMLNVYKKALTWVMKHKIKTLFGGLICLVTSLLLFVILPKDFLPDQDQGFLLGYTESVNGTSPFQMARYQEKVSKMLIEDPAVEKLVSLAAVSNDNEGIMFIRLKPYKERGSIDKVTQRLMEKLYTIVGINSYVSLIPTINLQVGTDAKALYQYTISGLDSKELSAVGEKLLWKLRELPGFVQVSSDLEIKQPQLEITIDRNRASDLKISAAKIETLLERAYSDNKISTINSPIDQYDVIIETLPEYYKDPTALSKLYVRSENNKLIPLKEIVNFSESVGPLTVNHFNGQPSVTYSFNIKDIPLSDALLELSRLQKEMIPKNISSKIQGTAEIFRTSFSTLPYLFLIMLFVIYIILGILYESFIHPLTVMSTLPPATFGALVTLYMFNETLSLYSFVGIIMLIGIVMKNGIMMVDFANDAIEKEKMQAQEAIVHACLIRFRPIMMTSIAALMGAVPIAIGIGGSSAQGRRPLGMAVVGGLLISQVLTLLLTPVIYYYMERLQEMIREKRELKKAKQVT